VKLPRRIKKKPRRTAAINCPGHKAYVKTYECALGGKISPVHVGYACGGPLDPHHTRSVGAGGGDEGLVPLCRIHHDLTHNTGLEWVFNVTGVDLLEMAEQLWDISKPGQRYRAKIKMEQSHD
jgi:hypothetical protein